MSTRIGFGDGYINISIQKLMNCSDSFIKLLSFNMTIVSLLPHAIKFILYMFVFCVFLVWLSIFFRLLV